MKSQERDSNLLVQFLIVVLFLMVFLGLELRHPRRAHAAEVSDISVLVDGGYLNSKNNGADDAGAVMVRVEKPIYHELSAALEADYHGRKYFPSVDDVKGSFGSLDGFGGMVDLIFRPVVSKKVSPYVVAGAGFFTWDFHENPFLQDNHVTVSVKPSFARQIGVGLDYKINDRWAFNIEADYFATDISKKAMDNTGREWHILGDDTIGNEEYQVRAGLRYWFN